MIRPPVAPVWRCLLLCLLLPALPAFAQISPSPPSPSTASPPLTLAAAIARSLEQDPELAAAGQAVRAADALAGDAGLRPNPDLTGEVENVLGSGERRGVRAAETTLQIGQLFELGGKRAARTAAAQRSRDVAAAEVEVRRLAAMVDTTAAFLAVIGAQERLALAGRRVTLAESLVPALERRVAAGGSPAADVARGRIAADLARIERDRAIHALEAARRALALRWGKPAADFGRAEARLDLPAGTLPRLELLEEALLRNPLVTRWEAIRASREAEIRVEQARAVPDVKLGIGARHFADRNDAAFVLSATLPLPVWNRNRGAIEAARRSAAQADAEREAARLSAVGKLSDAYATLESARGELASLQASILPTARRAYDELNQGYRQGRFGALELLDAQNTLGEAEARGVEALLSYHLAVAEIEGLTNRSLHLADAPSR